MNDEQRTEPTLGARLRRLLRREDPETKLRESLEETIAVLSDADLMQQLRESEAERAAGLMESAEDLDRAMQARRARGD